MSLRSPFSACLTECPAPPKLPVTNAVSNPLRSAVDFRVLLVVAVLSALFLPWLLVLVGLLVVYVFWFFRDPARVSPTDPNAVLAAADGTIADIVEIEEPEV